MQVSLTTRSATHGARPRDPARNEPYELSFEPLTCAQGRHAFPCDESGSVNLDALSARDRLDYLFVRTLVGRDFQRPRVCHATRPPGSG
jgi:hypothetical protein